MFKGRIVSTMDTSLQTNASSYLNACLSNLDPDTQTAKAWMELTSLWDFLNYELLEHVIQAFIPDDNLLQDLQQYVEAIKQFCSKVNMHKFFQTLPFYTKKLNETNFKKMVAKTRYSLEQSTLQDVKEIVLDIAILLLIPHQFLPLRNVEEGCVSIHWYVPPSVAAHVKSLEVQPDSMTNHRLLGITIDSVQIYPLTSTKKVSLRLKDLYKSKCSAMNLDSMKSFKLASIRNKNSIFVSDYAKSTLRRDKDVVRFNKSPTTLSSLGYLPDGSPARLVLIEGAAGVGKTTFTLNACIKWANKQLFNHINMLFLLPSRDFNVQSIMNLENLVALIAPGDMSLEKELKANDGEGVVFWLEGWDEIPSSLDGGYSFFEKLVSREILANAIVIVSSRPWATDFIKEQLDKQPSQHIEIVASVHDQVDWLIELKEKSSSIQSDLIDTFLKYLDETPAIKGNMHTPLATDITWTVYQWCRESNIGLPITVTQLYEAYACCCIRNFLQTDHQLDPEQWKSKDFNDLLEPYKTWFFDLCQLALNGLENRQQLVFSDVPNVLGLQTLGLMQAVSPLYVSEGSALVNYHFNHLTLQEFLAAKALSQLKNKERNAIIKKYFRDGFFTNVIRFFSGVIKPSPILINHVTKLFNSGNQQDKLIVFHLLFEGGDKVSIADIIGNNDMSIELDNSLSALDCFVTGYCIAQSDCAWNIDSSSAHMGDDKIIQFLQALIHRLEGKQRNLHITSLDFKNNDLTSQSIRYLPDVARHFFHHLKSLDLSHNELDGTALDHIAKIIPHTPQLEELNLGFNDIQRGGAVSLISTIVNHKDLKRLNLPATNIGEEDCEKIALLLSCSPCLRLLNVARNNLSSDSLHILFSGLKQSKIKYLTLANNKLGDSEVIALGQILAENTTIIELELSNCSISIAGGAELALLLKTNSTLKCLHICHMGRKTAQKFTELKQHNKALEIIMDKEDDSYHPSLLTSLSPKRKPKLIINIIVDYTDFFMY